MENLSSRPGDFGRYPHQSAVATRQIRWCYGVYIETSIVSHATAWPSLDIAAAALQHQALQWWATESSKFHLVTLQLVITEASVGDPNAAAERLWSVSLVIEKVNVVCLLCST